MNGLYATIEPGGRRFHAWVRDFGKCRVPIRSAEPIPIMILDHDDDSRPREVLAYFADLRAMKDDQISRLVTSLAARHGDLPSEVWESLDRSGLPILADGVKVLTCPPPRATIRPGRTRPDGTVNRFPDHRRAMGEL